jgi:hypothetical protein
MGNGQPVYVQLVLYGVPSTCTGTHRALYEHESADVLSSSHRTRTLSLYITLCCRPSLLTWAWVCLGLQWATNFGVGSRVRPVGFFQASQTSVDPFHSMASSIASRPDSRVENLLLPHQPATNSAYLTLRSRHTWPTPIILRPRPLVHFS